MPLRQAPTTPVGGVDADEGTEADLLLELDALIEAYPFEVPDAAS